MTRLVAPVLALSLAPLATGCFKDPGAPVISDTSDDGADSADEEESTSATTTDSAGDGDSGDGDGTTTGDGDGDTGAMEASCDDYCVLVEACEPEFAQYTTAGPCTAVCNMMPLGNVGDQTGNTVGCRSFYAIQAAEGGAEREQFCRNAGPAGNGVCGGLCESFCAIAMEACQGADAAFASTVECITQCMTWDATDPYTSTSPEADTYACRLKHLTYATILPGTHCGHVGDVSPVCA